MTIVDNIEARRFELDIEGQTVFANYKLENSLLYINYVESPLLLRGTDAASNLMEGIVETARSKNYKIVPICAYAVAWLKRHGEYHDVLA